MGQKGGKSGKLKEYIVHERQRKREFQERERMINTT